MGPLLRHPHFLPDTVFQVKTTSRWAIFTLISKKKKPRCSFDNRKKKDTPCYFAIICKMKMGRELTIHLASLQREMPDI